MQRRVAKLPRSIDWDDARVLLALLRAPTLIAAARALGIDKSTLSRRLDALERALGVRLFARTREGLRPTPVAERLRVHAERIESEVLSLTSAAIARADEVRGRVRIATTGPLAVRLIQNGLLDLQTEYPGLELEVLGGNRSVDLAKGEAEIAIRVSATRDPGLLVRVLGRYPIALFAAPAYLRERGMPRTPKQLSGHHVLLQSGDLAALPEARWLAKRPGVRVAFRSNSMSALVEAATQGRGVIALTRAWGQAVQGLDVVFDLAAVAARPTWLVMHPDVAKEPLVRVVADRIAAGFRQAAAR